MNDREIYDPTQESIGISNDSMNSSVIYYQIVDSSHYSFTYSTYDGIEINMTESDRERKTTEFVDAEFEEDLSESDRICYIAAAMSGVLTGVIRNFGIADAFEDYVENFKNDKNWKKFVVNLANKLGYMKSDYDGAVKYIANMAVNTGRNNGFEELFEQVQKCLSKLSAHPTVVGLIFSITSQFSEVEYSIIDNELEKATLPEYYTVGRNYHEKVVYGFLYWVFDLAVNRAFSKRNIIDNLNLPKQLTDLIKAFLDTDLMKNVPQNYDEAITIYSKWLKNLFENTEIREDDDLSRTFDLESSINNGMKGFYRDTMPIVLNECIIRGFYFIHKLTHEIKQNGISYVYDLNRISAERILPYNNRTISRMCLISSSTYVAINTGRVVIEYIKGKKVGERNFKEVLLETLDFPGIFRLCIAVAMDSVYWRDDINIIFEKIRNANYKEKVDNEAEQSIVDEEDEFVDEEVFEKFTLDALQARLLYSFESIYVQKDIEKTADPKDRMLKKKWFDLWQARILIGQSADSGNIDYFVSDENMLYEGLYELSKDKNNLSRLYLMGTDLVLFEPYHPLGVQDDKSFKKLKIDYNYINDQFIRRQTIVSQQEVDLYLDKYKKYYDLLSGNKARLAAKIGITAAVSVATGGLALAFAPSIAVALAGEAVVGLHGAALTSASLAFIGGGSLAAGGLGMAGGTAIITGGGALLGLASSTGTVSVASMLNQMDENSIVRMSAKLSAFCDVIIKGIFKDNITLQNLIEAVDKIIYRSENELEEIKAEDNDLDKKLIEKLKNYIKNMKKLEGVLEKILATGE